MSVSDLRSEEIRRLFSQQTEVYPLSGPEHESAAL